MNADDELRSAFGRQADQALSPNLVQDLIAQGIDRRRRRQQTGAVLGVSAAVTGLVIGVSSLRSGGSHAVSSVAASPTATLDPTPLPTPLAVSSSPLPETDADRAVRAYFSAGYDYDDALVMARLWGGSDNMFVVKAVAGQIIGDGGQLPIQHGDATGPSSDRFARNLDEFALHHTISEAEHLASLWQVSTTEAKWYAGQLLRDGQPLPTS